MLALAAAHAAEPLNILYLTKSQGFQHSVVVPQDGGASESGAALTAVAEKLGAKITCSKDASLLDAESIKNFDLVILYTTGDLTKPSDDGGDAMADQASLIEWVENGGALMGFHAATDTFHETQPGQPTPFIQMMGAEFLTHGAPFEGTLNVVDPDHPAMANFEDGWKVHDEWYVFKNINTKDMHVLATLDPGEQRTKQADKYDIPAYPMVWCMERGKGRVYFNGMGHFPQVWADPDFQQVVSDAIQWVTGAEAGAADDGGDAGDDAFGDFDDLPINSMSNQQVL